MLLPVILAGGFGERLWPLSREAHPKQFLPLLEKQTLLQQTLSRLPKNTLPPLIICHEAHRFIVAEQLRSHNIQACAILLEPARKNTAPAIALAAQFARAHYPEATLAILPADHLLKEHSRFHQALKAAMPIAQSNYFVTFGIEPIHADTGFGYIQLGDPLLNSPLYQIKQFVEKPDLKTAQQFLDSKKYLWNSGMFLFQPTPYLKALAHYDRIMTKAIEQAFSKATIDQDFIRPDPNDYNRIHAISIDYAIMEKTQQAAVLPLAVTWNDVGNFNALWQINSKDPNNNVVSGNTQLLDTQDCLVHAEKRLVATLGIQNLLVIETPDAVLVANRNCTHAIKTLVQTLKNNHITQATEHQTTLRPWGSFEVLSESAQFKVKRLQIAPLKSLSLQKHQHRNEHWVVVEGTATVTCGTKTFTLHKNESTYIPKDTKHRLQNFDTTPLIVIEVQSGAYLGEDDIIRFSDHYGRVTNHADTTPD